MRTILIGTACVVLAAAAATQRAVAQAPAPRLAVSAAEVATFVAKARNERKPDQANFIQPLVQLAPYTVNLEYRVGSVVAAASVHEREAELFYVLDGSGTMVTGGKLRDEKRTNAENLTGAGIEGGMSRHVAKGDFVMVPENTPHWFSQIDGTLVLASFHVPHAGSAATTR
jgi:mannose-6-phosphate isomerase-like protein (cupin superfamily)